MLPPGITAGLGQRPGATPLLKPSVAPLRSATPALSSGKTYALQGRGQSSAPIDRLRALSIARPRGRAQQYWEMWKAWVGNASASRTTARACSRTIRGHVSSLSRFLLMRCRSPGKCTRVVLAYSPAGVRTNPIRRVRMPTRPGQPSQRGITWYGVRPFSGFLLICPPRCPAHSLPARRSSACLLRVAGTREAALQAHSQEGVVYET